MFENLHTREARPASVGWIVVKTLTISVLFWIVFFYLIPAGLYRLEEPLHLNRFRFDRHRWQIPAVALFILAGLLGVTSSLFMAMIGKGTMLPVDCAPRLVVVGPYRWVRNPMALTGITQAGAVGLYFGSPVTLLYALAAFFIWNYGIRPWEERDLERRFGAAYLDYKQSVKCWIPRLRPYDPPA